MITVTSHKGGVGKTTTSIHLAGVLAEEYGAENVAVVDTDPNESALDHYRRGFDLTDEAGLPFRVAGPGERVEERHVVFDSQGRLAGEDLEAALEGSDLLVVPTMPDFAEITALARFVADVQDAEESIQATGLQPAPYKVLLTMVPWYERVYCPGRSELEDAGVPLFKGQIEARKAFKHAAANGVMVGDVRGRAGRLGGEDYRKVGKELIGEIKAVAP